MTDSSLNDAAYSRENPSPLYLELLEQYEILHAQKKDEQKKEMFPGKSLYPHIESIKKLIEHVDGQTLLDYGSGKGQQYQAAWVKKAQGMIIGLIPKYWDCKVTLWEPNYPPLAKKPETTFDCVISTDVLEHIPDTDLGWMLGEIMGFAKKAVFINVGNYPAHAILPNGMNAHVTVRPTEWWRELVEEQAARHPHLKYVVRISHDKGRNWDDISNFDWQRPVPTVGVIPAGILPACRYYLKRLFS